MATIAGLGCATQPAALATSADVRSELKVVNLEHIEIRDLIDKRPKNAELSDMLGRPMAGSDFMEWVQSSLNSFGLDIGDKADNSAVACPIVLEVRRADVRTSNTVKSANLVFGARNINTGDYNVYRGVDTTVNWVGGQGETNNALSRAFFKALAKLDKDCNA